MSTMAFVAAALLRDVARAPAVAVRPDAFSARR